VDIHEESAFDVFGSKAPETVRGLAILQLKWPLNLLDFIEHDAARLVDPKQPDNSGQYRQDTKYLEVSAWQEEDVIVGDPVRGIVVKFVQPGVLVLEDLRHWFI